MDNIILPNDVVFDSVQQLLDEGKDVVIIVKGWSMLPSMRHMRDSVRLHRVEKELREGDVVLAKIGSKYVMHRLIGIKGDSLVLKGDGVLVNTESCKKKDILGVVTCIIRKNGKEVQPNEERLWRKLPVLIRKVVLVVLSRIYR